jgi:hypothetical protein
VNVRYKFRQIAPGTQKPGIGTHIPPLRRRKPADMLPRRIWLAGVEDAVLNGGNIIGWGGRGRFELSDG